MKTLFKVLALGTLLTASSVLTFAQEKTAEDLAKDYATYKTEKAKPCGQRSAAITLGKSIVDTYEKIPAVYEDNKPVIEFVKKDYPKLEAADATCARNNRYDSTYKAKDWAGFFTVSKEIIAAPENSNGTDLDVMLDAVSVGYDRAVVDKVDTYNNDTLNFAKTALQKIESGKTSKTGKYGVFIPFNTKENAQSWMNYIIGWEMYYKLNQKNKEALAYMYKSTQIGTEKKGDTVIYTNIGTYYFDEAIRLDTEYRDKRKANNNEDNDETKALLALARGTADRAIDAYGRAYKIAQADAKALPAYKTGLYKTLTDLYKFRFNLAPDAKTPDLDKYVADLVAKPMPDPSTAVTPVVEEVKPATTTTTSTTTTTTTPATTTTTPTTTTTKPAATTTTTTKSTTTATTTKPATTTPVKKPVTKKKGTR
ncbi:MAG TPA: hypothetical protein VNB22_02840 [Pyrinomonadaceae bacterium]|nr:hypothetical protein [Pyrinomonadaceae bacterium]